MRIFRKGPGPNAMALAMAGVRLGERLLDVGAAAANLFAEMAGKVGLTGRACAIVGSEAAGLRVKAAAAKAGVLAEVEVTSWPGLPVGDGEFDLAIVDETAGLLASLDWTSRVALAGEALRALRPGGRLLVVERLPRGLLGVLKGQGRQSAGFQEQGGARSVLEHAGFRPVRVLAEREGQRFTEGWKAAAVSPVP